MRDPARFLHEQQTIDALCAEVDWIERIKWRIELSSATVEVDVDLRVHGIARPVTLTYPDVFPNTPAYVCQRDKTQRWTSHQYGAGGPFCLEWRADNWDLNVTGADILRSTYKLLLSETNPDGGAPVMSAHQVTLGQELRSDSSRLLITPGLVSALSNLAPHTVTPIQTSSLVDGSTFVCLVRAVADETGAFVDIEDVPKALGDTFRVFTWSRSGFVVKSTAIKPLPENPTRADFQTAIVTAYLSSPNIKDPNPEYAKLKNSIYLLSGASGTLSAFCVHDDSVMRYGIIGIQNSAIRLPSSHTALAGKRVGIVGLGSIGSKMAVSLARSGCRRFLLVDDDILLPENLCRHELSWGSVGFHKAAAIKSALSYIAPGIEVDSRIHRLAGQESSVTAARVLKVLSSCDLIIDATANPDVFLRLAAIAQSHSASLCWGEVFAGGVGGMIARARPSTDANPLAVRNGYLEHLKTLPPAPYRNERRYDVLDNVPVIADDADVTHISSSLARLALDTLIDRQPTAFPAPVYLIGLRKEWVFQSAFDTHPINIVGQGWDQRAATEEERKVAIEKLVDLTREQISDSSDPAGSDMHHNRSSSSQSGAQ